MKQGVNMYRLLQRYGERRADFIRGHMKKRAHNTKKVSNGWTSYMHREDVSHSATHMW